MTCLTATVIECDPGVIQVTATVILMRAGVTGAFQHLVRQSM
ncbi:MAG TPA: hypothetical protein PK417_03880 [Hyphomonas sp.]|nr:hypothetical protein [Hyphomonas sp.]